MDCVCPDLQERFNKIKESPHLVIGGEYEKQIKKQAENPEKSINE